MVCLNAQRTVSSAFWRGEVLILQIAVQIFNIDEFAKSKLDSYLTFSSLVRFVMQWSGEIMCKDE